MMQVVSEYSIVLEIVSLKSYTLNNQLVPADKIIYSFPLVHLLP